MYVPVNYLIYPTLGCDIAKVDPNNQVRKLTGKTAFCLDVILLTTA